MMTINNNQNNQPDIIKHILFRYLPYWPIFLFLIVICAAGAWVYLKLATPVYESTAKLLIDDEKKGAQESEAIASLDKLSASRIIENETEVIQSKALLSEVAKRLDLYAVVTEEKKFNDVSAYTTSPVKIIALNKNDIKPSEKVHFTVNKSNKTIKIGSKQYAFDEWIKTGYGIIKFIPNPDLSGTNSGKFYFTLSPLKNVVDDIGSNLTVSTSTKESSILDLSFKDENPVKSKNILNEILVAYNVSVINDKTRLAANTLNFIDSRLANVGHDLDSIEYKVQQYKAQQNAVDIGTQGRLYLENLSSNDQRLGEINMQLAVVNQVQGYVQSKNGNEGIVPSASGLNDPMLSQLLEKLYDAQTEYDNLRKTTGADNPIVVSVKDQIEKIKPNILENIQNHKTTLLASRQNLSSTSSSYAGVLQAIPQKEKRLIDINRQQGIKNNLYDFLLQKKEETSLSLLSNTGSSKVIDEADYSSMPVSPNKKLAYISSLLIALFAGIGIVMGKETFARNIMFRNDIETLTAQPVIAEIGASAYKAPQLLQSNTRNIITEQFRKLRITLRYLGINSSTQKRILVTSAISGEGKSFIASNLSLNLALEGKKVVLVDFDLIKPSLSNSLDIKNGRTLSDYLIDGNDVESLIHHTEFNDNLFFIPAGEMPESASELMRAERIETLLNYLDGVFDFIVIDSAPVNPITDAYILSPYCDATLYVIRHNYTPKIFVEQLDNANNKQLKNVAIVFNGVRSRGYGNKNYGYGYSYGDTYPAAKRKTGVKQIMN